MWYILENFTFSFFVMLSIGISNGIELFTNPTVHRIHNMPDVYSRRMDFKDYRWWHAAYTGIKASWFLLLPLSFLPLSLSDPISWKMICLINILIPLGLYVMRLDVHNPFLGHQLLYCWNIVTILQNLIQ